MEFAIVIATRLKSNRIPNKALREIEGKSILERLYDQIKCTDIPVIFAFPGSEKDEYLEFVNTLRNKNSNKKIYSVYGHDDDPLARLNMVAKTFNVKNVIRITHDKIFVNPVDIISATNCMKNKKIDYIHSSKFIDGCAFEIISNESLRIASKKFKNVEFVSYAIRNVTDNIHEYEPFYKSINNDERLLIDYEEDLEFMQSLIVNLPKNSNIDDVLRFTRVNNWIKKINQLPKVTIYTCAYNAEKYIKDCFYSVVSQYGFNDFEYIIVDDCSSDSTTYQSTKLASQFKNVKYIRNHINRGLARSSNTALKNSKSKYIIRLDADDFFINRDCIQNILSAMGKSDVDAIYPQNLYGSKDRIQYGYEQHHVGGTLFKTKALNHLKFTDNLRNYEGLDFFGRAKDLLKISYYDEPIFFYRQHDESMSKTNIKQREIIKRKIEEKYGL